MASYDRKCTECNHTWVHHCKIAERNEEFPCSKCGGPSLRMLTAPHVLWNHVAITTAGFPSAEANMLRDREARKKKEQENVENSGTEYPNLLTV